MSLVRDGIPASPGIVIAPARVLRWEVPRVPHGGVVAADQVEHEVERFREAREWAKERIRELQARTETLMGRVEAQIFEPQILMLEDSDLIEGTISYIRENHLTAERAFEWRVLEWESQWSHTAHPMVLDKLNDLADVQNRVLRRLMGMPDPELRSRGGEDKVVLVAHDLTPSLTVQLDPRQVVGIATDSGTRASHNSILARSLDIPAVVSLGDLSDRVRDGDEIILDGRAGRVIIGPSEEDKHAYRERDFQIREWEQELLLLAHLESVTRDGYLVQLRANIDLPGEATSARAHGAEGVGRGAAPGEEEQFQAYSQVTRVVPHVPVIIRTYDLGGDKFPAFMHMAPEDNPFLGWRAIRVCLDEPAMFRGQLRALLRAAAHADVRIMIPLVNEVSEVLDTRRHIDECLAELRAEGHEVPERYSLGAMIETPAAAMSAPELARHVDFFSIGTNDLTQYTLAVDRGNSRLSKLYNPFHPAVVRLMGMVTEAGRAAGIEVGVCGEFAAHPLGAFLMIGLGVHSLSVGPSALAEIKKVIRSVSREEAAAAAREALAAGTPAEVIEVLGRHAEDWIDLTRFMAAWNLSATA